MTSPSNQTVTSKTRLPGFLEDAYKGSIDAATQLHDAGVGFSPYPGATYVPPSEQELAGVQQIEGIIGQGNPLVSPAIQQFQNILSSGGITPGQQTALDPLRASARGDFLGGNPYIMDVLGQAERKASTAVANQMAALGREASPYHTETLTREIGDLYSRGLMQNYEQERGRQLQSASQLYGALGMGTDRALQYAGMAPQMSEFRFADPSKLINVGASQRGELQSELQSLIDKFQQTDMAPWNRLGMANQVIQGSAQPFMTQQQTGPGGSPIASGLGGGLTALGALGGAGLMSQPWAWPLVGGATALGALS